MCFVLLIICVVGTANGPAGMAFFYEKEVQDKAIELGLTTRETIMLALNDGINNGLRVSCDRLS